MESRTQQERLQRLLLGQERFLEAVHGMLDAEQKHDDILRACVLTSRGGRIVPIQDADPARVFHADDIRRICVRYRLRFLDGACFKGKIPVQAVHQIRLLEDRTGEVFSAYKVVAPARRFKLCDGDADPVLFVALGGDRYYLVHKWGRDLAWYRPLLTWPLRGPWQLALTVLLLASLLSALVPASLLTNDPLAGWWGAQRALFMFWSVMVSASFTGFAWFTFFGQFSAEAWNSKHFN